MLTLLKNKLTIFALMINIFLLSSACYVLFIWFNSSFSQIILPREEKQSSKTLQKLIFQPVNIKGTFQKFTGIPSKIKEKWTGFRGPFHNNINQTSFSLKGTLNKDKREIIWKKAVGEGYAGAAINNGCVYILDYDKEAESDSLRCFALNSGQEIWRRSYKTSIKRNHGISRTVPAVNDKYIVSIGPKCHVMCLDSITGEYKWGIDLVNQYKTKVPLWYTAQCPLIIDDIAVIAPAGTKLLIGVDLESGKILWETPNEQNFKMSHSSIMPMTFHKTQMLVYAAIGGIVAIKAKQPEQGKILWQTNKWNFSVVSPSPVQINDNKFLITSGYGAGSAIFQVMKNEKSFSVSNIKTFDKSLFACEQHTPIFYKNHIFSILPNDAGKLNKQLVCIDTNGNMIWNSGSNNRFGLGPFIIADDKFFILNNDGELTIAQADVKKFHILSKSKVLTGRESWAPIAIAETKMIVRDLKELICLDLKK